MPLEGVFFDRWCIDRGLVATTCPISEVLTFLQELFDAGRAASTLGVFAAAMTAGHQGFGRFSVRSHPMVKRFLSGARRLRPPSACIVPRWSLQVVLEGLCCPLFDSLESVALDCLSLMTVFLLTLVSAKGVSDLSAFLVAPDC